MAFAEYEEMSDKHEYISDIKTTLKDKKSIAKTLAVYSAFTEGYNSLVALQSC